MVGQNVSFCTKFATIVFDWVAGKQYNGVVFGIFEIRNAWLWDYPSPPKKKMFIAEQTNIEKLRKLKRLRFFVVQRQIVAKK